MVNNKKIIVAGSMIVVLGALMVGCSTDSKTDKAATGTTAPSTTAPAARGQISTTIYDRGNIAAGQGTIEENRWTKWINEKGPATVKFVAVPRNESQQKLNVLFASGNAPILFSNFHLASRTHYMTKSNCYRWMI